MPENITWVPPCLDTLQAWVVRFVIQRLPGHARGIQGRIREVGVRVIDKCPVVRLARDRHAPGLRPMEDCARAGAKDITTVNV